MTNKLAVAGPNSKFQDPGAKPAGFWAGYWHGMISPFTFIVGLFKPGVRFYETNNNGGWYDFGFLLGASAALGGSKVSVRVQAKPRQDKEESQEKEYAFPAEETPE